MLQKKNICTEGRKTRITIGGESFKVLDQFRGPSNKPGDYAVILEIKLHAPEKIATVFHMFLHDFSVGKVLWP